MRVPTEADRVLAVGRRLVPVPVPEFEFYETRTELSLCILSKLTDVVTRLRWGRRVRDLV